LCCEQKQGMNLKYLDFNNCFSILSKFAFLLSNLVEIRIGSDAPPQMRLTTPRLLVDNSQLVSQIGFTFSQKINIEQNPLIIKTDHK
jgi:hypothetical protein